MAAATDRHQGSISVVYCTADDPAADPIDPANYTVLGMRTTANLNSQAPETTISDVHGATVSYGANAGTYNLAWNRSKGGDDGQAILRAAHKANPKTTVWFLVSSNVTGEDALTFKGTIGSFTRNDDDETPSTEGCVVGLDGGFTETEITE